MVERSALIRGIFAKILLQFIQNFLTPVSIMYDGGYSTILSAVKSLETFVSNLHFAKLSSPAISHLSSTLTKGNGRFAQGSGSSASYWD